MGHPKVTEAAHCLPVTQVRGRHHCNAREKVHLPAQGTFAQRHARADTHIMWNEPRSCSCVTG